MAGHSQFKNIMFRKGAQDAKRSKLFSKLAREITVSAKGGLPDPEKNPKLRAAIIAARKENMPKDNIERAIKKALGGDVENYEEVRYEGRGPGGVSMIVEALTDNRNRTGSDVRSLFSKYGGQMGETVAYQFDRLGQIQGRAQSALSKCRAVERHKDPGEVKPATQDKHRARRRVQDLLGHSSPNTTQIYTHVSQARQAEVSEAAWTKIAEDALGGGRRRARRSDPRSA